MIPKYAARADANHTEITEALRRCGWQTYAVRLPADLLIVKPGRPMLLADIKSHRKAKWTAVQRDVQARGFPLVRLETVEDVERLTRGTIPRQIA